ncbi:MAG: vancomycin resistance protein, partial [bacterium]|nr:vancomycin resistance protein [bacterium]
QSWDARPAPPAVYTVDPSLPPGAVKQVDWANPGIKTRFTHTIRDKDGQVLSEKQYSSNYVPWSAKYITGP